MVWWAWVNYRDEEDSTLVGGITALLPFSFYPHLWLCQHPCIPFGLWSFLLALWESFPGANPETSWRDLQLSVGAMLSSRALLWRSVVGNIISGSTAAKLRWQTHNFEVCLVPRFIGTAWKAFERRKRGKGRTTKHLGRIFFDCAGCWNVDVSALMCESMSKGERLRGLRGLSLLCREAEAAGTRIACVRRLWHFQHGAAVQPLSTHSAALHGWEQPAQRKWFAGKCQQRYLAGQASGIFVSLKLHLGLWSLLMHWN